MAQCAMVMVELCEDVVGVKAVWSSGERRPVTLSVAARWIDAGVANPVLPKRRRRLATEAPEQAVVLPYAIPEEEWN